MLFHPGNLSKERERERESNKNNEETEGLVYKKRLKDQNMYKLAKL